MQRRFGDLECGFGFREPLSGRGLSIVLTAVAGVEFNLLGFEPGQRLSGLFEHVLLARNVGLKLDSPRFQLPLAVGRAAGLSLERFQRNLDPRQHGRPHGLLVAQRLDRRRQARFLAQRTRLDLGG